MSNVRGLQFNQTSYNSKPQDPALDVATGSQLHLYKATVVNGTGGAIAMGILRKLTDIKLEYGSGDGAAFTSIYSNPTGNTVQAPFTAFAGGTVSLIVGQTDKFNLIGLALGVTVANTTTYEYWDGAAWQTLPTLEAFGAGVNTPYDYVTFLAPHDWAKGGTETGLSTNKYYIRMVNATASTADTVTNIITGQMLTYRASVVSSLTLEAPSEDKPFQLDSGEGLIPYFGTEDPANFLESTYNIVS
jgi:hypothetical protein